MPFLLNLKIRFKILSIVVVSIFGFASTLIVISVFVASNVEQLVKVRDAYYPVLELATANTGYLTRMEESFATAVSIGETDPLEQSAELEQLIIAGLKTQSEKFPEKSSQITTIIDDVKNYNALSYQIAFGMIEGTIDMNDVSRLVEKSNSFLSKTKSGLSELKLQSYNEFSQVIESIIDKNQQLQIISLFSGLITAAIILFVGMFVSRNVVQRIAKVGDSLSKVSFGDLTVRINDTSHDEIGSLSQSFNQFVAVQQQTISDTLTAIKTLDQQSTSLADASSDTKQQISFQGDKINKIFQSIGEMLLTVGDVAKGTAQASADASNADKQAGIGANVVKETITTINQLAAEISSSVAVTNQLEKHVNDVDKILATIGAISEQTNLLALNAAIESARAGEAGRGFAVVADEVRTLALRTQESTKEISIVLDHLKDLSQQSVKAMNQSNEMAAQCIEHSESARESLSFITDGVAAISHSTGQIAVTTEQQNQTSTTIRDDLESIQRSAKDTTQSTNNLDVVTESINNITKRLTELTINFNV